MAATVFSVEYGADLTMRAASFLYNALVLWRGKASGDLGLCTSAEIYRQSGGFPPYPCLEDMAFCARLRPFGRVVQLWRELRYALGADPADLWGGQDDY